MAGFAGNGAPLQKLLETDYGALGARVTDALVSGVGLGKGFKEIAKDMRDAMGMEFDRSLRIARTEINRSYRLANAEQYRKSGVVEKVLRLCFKPTACFACLEMDGEECPNGICDDHPNGKCTTIVQTTGGIVPEWEKGSDWLLEQSPEDQRRIMGLGRYDLWKNEGVDPRSMVYMKPNPVWGGSPSVKTFDMMREQGLTNDQKNEKRIYNRLFSGKNQDLAVEERARLYRNNSNNVPLNALDAPRFTEKFKGITGNEETNETIYKSAVEILKHRNRTDDEDLFLIDMDTGEEIHKHMRSTGMLGVQYDDEIKQAIAKAHNEGRRIVAIHNHPNGLPPTLDDGSTALYRGYDLGIAVGHNLEVWSYSKSNQAYEKKFCDAVHDALNEKILYLPQFDEDEWYNTLRGYGMEVKRL